MRKLLRAGYARLFRNKCFWGCALVNFCFGLYLILQGYHYAGKEQAPFLLDADFFNWVPILCMLTSLLIPLFLGTEYSDGTIRNKLIIGQKRSAIYLSNLLLCLSAALAVAFAFVLPYLGLGLLLHGRLACGWRTLARLSLLALAVSAATASLYVLIAMLCHNKAASAAACILLIFCLLLSCNYLNATLSEPEFYSGFAQFVNGEMVISDEPEPNSRYVGGTRREIYEFLYESLPGGQLIQLANMEVEHPAAMASYSAGLFFAATAAGVAFFRRKDIK